MKVENRLLCLLLEFFDLPADTPSESITQQALAHWDSLAMVQLITELEREFCLQFDIDEISRLRSYDEIRETLDRKGILVEKSPDLRG